MEGYRKGRNEAGTGKDGRKEERMYKRKTQKATQKQATRSDIHTARLHKERGEKTENSPMKQPKKIFPWVSTEKGQHHGGTRSAPKHIPVRGKRVQG